MHITNMDKTFYFLQEKDKYIYIYQRNEGFFTLHMK